MPDLGTLTQYGPTLGNRGFRKEEYNLGRITLESVKEEPVDTETSYIDEETDDSRAQLNQAVIDSYDVLATAQTTKSMFPDTLTLDRTKLTVTKRKFFSSAEVSSMRIEDVLNVTETIGPLFGSVTVVSRVMNANKPMTIGLFWRKDAIKMKRIIQGYIIALQREIDCGSLPAAELTEMLEMLGEDNHKIQ